MLWRSYSKVKEEKEKYEGGLISRVREGILLLSKVPYNVYKENVSSLIRIKKDESMKLNLFQRRYLLLTKGIKLEETKGLKQVFRHLFYASLTPISILWLIISIFLVVVLPLMLFFVSDVIINLIKKGF